MIYMKINTSYILKKKERKNQFRNSKPGKHANFRVHKICND